MKDVLEAFDKRCSTSFPEAIHDWNCLVSDIIGVCFVQLKHHPMQKGKERWGRFCMIIVCFSVCLIGFIYGCSDCILRGCSDRRSLQEAGRTWTEP